MRFARERNSQEFRKAALEWFATESNSDDSDEFNHGSLALAEEIWAALNRPYYNVWPIAISLAASVKLDLRFSQVNLPFHAILLRFAKGREPHSLGTALVFWPKAINAIQVFCTYNDGEDSMTMAGHAIGDDDTIEDWLTNLECHGCTLTPHQHAAGLLVVRLVVFILLLARGEDTITPVVLAKDRPKYDATTDQDVRRWIEERALRRVGRGFDVCKRLQSASDASPHWRNPHLCLFWTGEGRSVPIIQMRSGAIIQAVSMADVPTGFLGPENEAEGQLDADKTPRETLRTRRRFLILQRDNFRCQLCGASSEDSASLHVDHKIPLAKGGSNEDDNLWTLCDRCNLGKSDLRL